LKNSFSHVNACHKVLFARSFGIGHSLASKGVGFDQEQATCLSKKEQKI